MKINTKTKYSLLLALVSFGIFTLLAFLLSPIHFSLMNNIIYAESVSAVIFELVIGLLGIIVFPVSYAIIVYSAYKFTFSKIIGQLFIFGGSVIYYHGANTLVSYLDYGDFNIVELYYVLTSLGSELLLHALVLAVCLVIASSGKEGRAVLPKTAAWAGIILSATKLLQRMYQDLFVLEAPSGRGEIVEMIIYYFSDILVGFLVYAVMHYIYLSFEKKAIKKAE